MQNHSRYPAIVMSTPLAPLLLAATLRMQSQPWRIAEAVYGRAATVTWPPISGETPVQVLHDCACRIAIFDGLRERNSRDYNIGQHLLLIAAEIALLEMIVGPDFVSDNLGSVITLRPVSQDGKEWARRHLGEAPLGVINFEHRFFVDAATALLADGLTMQDAATGKMARLPG